MVGFNSPIRVTPGQTVTLRVSVRNSGAVPAPASKILVTLAKSASISDVFEGVQAIYDVPPIMTPSTPEAERTQSNHVWVTWTVTIPQTNLPSIYFMAKSDPDNQIAESNENDNAGGTEMNVTQP